MSRSGTKVTTGKVRMNYVVLENPRSVYDFQDPKYSMSILIPKEDSKTLIEIGEALDEVWRMAEVKWGRQVEGLYMPIKDGDVERPDDKAYKGHFFLNASSRYKPLLLDQDKVEIMDAREVYSGCYGRVVIQFYLYDAPGRRGIGCTLQGVQKLYEGQQLGAARISAMDFDEEWVG